MKIGKSLAYASRYYFHRLWVARSAVSDCAQNDQSDALAMNYCHTPLPGPPGNRPRPVVTAGRQSAGSPAPPYRGKPGKAARGIAAPPERILWRPRGVYAIIGILRPPSESHYRLTFQVRRSPPQRRRFEADVYDPIRDITIRARLCALVTISTVGLAAMLGLAAWVLHQYRIQGPVHRDLQLARGLVTEMEPAVMAIFRPQLIVEGLAGTTDPPAITRRLDELRVMEGEYRARYDHWTKAALDPEIKNEIVECNKPAEEYFRLVHDEFVPALRDNQAGKAKKLFDEKLKPCFSTYQDTYKKAMLRIHDIESKTQKSADESASFWMSWMVILSSIAVVSIGLLGWLTTRSITHSTDKLLVRVREMAGGAGDLTARVEIDASDELAQLAAGINAMIAKIHSVVERMREGSVQLLSTSAQIAATAKQQQGTVQGLSSATTEIAAAVREISATSDALAGTMAEVSSRAGQAAALAATGREGLDGIETTMQQLLDSTDSISVKLGVVREKAESINAVVTTITKVADQTNLLSINAAIEAEKAGEYGRGFLVVAREIRRLADQTAVATLDIENMVRLMQDAVSAGVMQMDKFGGEFRSGVVRVKEINGQTGRIIEEVEGVTSRFQAVNEGMHSQSVAARQINEAIVPVANGTKETQVSLEEFIKATAYLRQSVELLNQEIAQFKV